MVANGLAHARHLAKHWGIEPESIDELRIISLHGLGTLKSSVLYAMPGQLLRHIGTDVLIWAQYPTMPLTGESQQVSGPVKVAMESGPSTCAEADDVDEEANDFNADGRLPEALSSATEGLSTSQEVCPSRRGPAQG